MLCDFFGDRTNWSNPFSYTTVFVQGIIVKIKNCQKKFLSKEIFVNKLGCQKKIVKVIIVQRNYRISDINKLL